MARRGAGTGSGMVGGGGSGMLAPVLSIATGLLIFVILQIFAPTIAGTIEQAQPDFGTTCSYVNATDSVTYTGACGTTNATDTANTFSTAYSEDAKWNPDYNSDIPTGVDTWTTNVRILGVVILVISIAIAMYYLKSM